ncbi:DNA-3-methyladenine glycosylase I [Eionea flava]
MNPQQRCSWCGTDPLYVEYHDNEWGIPKKDDQELFELLLLEGAQAGLSWITILKKRENYREAFDNFDAKKMESYTQEKYDALLQNAGIIRNKLKVHAFSKNARAYLAIKESGISFSEFLWQFTDHTVIKNAWETLADIPTSTPESEAMSKALKKAGFSFVGPTICYAFMQSSGMVNDHTTDCFKYTQS